MTEIIQLKKIIGNYLPETFKPSKLIKNAWEVEDFGIVRSVWLAKSNFHPGGKKWYLSVSVDFKSNYDDDLDFHHHIVEGSTKGKEVCSKDDMRALNHWNEGEEAAIENTLHETILPWLDLMGQPDVFSDFLSRSMVVGTDGKNSEHKAIFGSIIMSKEYDPPRVRKLNLGFLATIYERMGSYEKALENLLKFQLFFEKDASPNMTPSEVKYRNTVTKQIEEGIQRLKGLLS